jgi:hypothetical protein
MEWFSWTPWPRTKRAWAGFILLLGVIVLCQVVFSPECGLRRFLLITCFISALIYLPLILYENVADPLIWGIQCPACRAWATMRVAAVALGSVSYRCASCGQRCRRADQGPLSLDTLDKENKDMLKQVDNLGTSRKRQVVREVLAFGLFVIGMIACTMVGGYIGGGRSGVFASIIFCVTWVFLLAATKGQAKINSTNPAVWDREVDL